jgi:hypothetical protein
MRKLSCCGLTRRPDPPTEALNRLCARRSHERVSLVGEVADGEAVRARPSGVEYLWAVVIGVAGLGCRGIRRGPAGEISFSGLAVPVSAVDLKDERRPRRGWWACCVIGILLRWNLPR